jgi:hypothetical protein
MGHLGNMTGLCYTQFRMSQEVAIISAATAILAIVIAIFGASWLNQRNIEKLLDQMEKRFDSRFDQMEKRFDARFDQMEKRFDARFDTVLAEIKRLDQRIDSLELRIDRIERQLEAIFKPVLPPRT